MYWQTAISHLLQTNKVLQSLGSTCNLPQIHQCCLIVCIYLSLNDVPRKLGPFAPSQASKAYCIKSKRLSILLLQTITVPLIHWHFRSSSNGCLPVLLGEAALPAGYELWFCTHIQVPDPILKRRFLLIIRGSSP